MVQRVRDTDQWKKTGKSDWEAIYDLYKDNALPARWILKTPATYGGVVSGPTSLPVDVWTTVDTGTSGNTDVCEPSITFIITHVWGSPAVGASVVLRKSDREIQQGQTDSNGEITVLGAADGDRVIASLWGVDLRINSTQVSCTSGLQAFQQATDETIQLLPAAYDLTISTLPGNTTGQIQVVVEASTSLSAAPETYLTQNGASKTTVSLFMTATYWHISGRWIQTITYPSRE